MSRDKIIAKIWSANVLSETFFTRALHFSRDIEISLHLGGLRTQMDTLAEERTLENFQPTANGTNNNGSILNHDCLFALGKRKQLLIILWLMFLREHTWGAFAGGFCNTEYLYNRDWWVLITDSGVGRIMCGYNFVAKLGLENCNNMTGDLGGSSCWIKVTFNWLSQCLHDPDLIPLCKSVYIQCTVHVHISTQNNNKKK